MNEGFKSHRRSIQCCVIQLMKGKILVKKSFETQNSPNPPNNEPHLIWKCVAKQIRMKYYPTLILTLNLF